MTGTKVAQPTGGTQSGDQPEKMASPGKIMSVKSAIEESLKHYGAGRLDAALGIISQVVAARPRIAEAQNLMGAILASQGKRAEAVKAMQRATRLAPKNAQYFSNLGEVERQRGKLAEASVALREALHLSPNNPQVLNNLGILHYDRKEYEEAAQCYTQALKFSRRAYPEAHNNLGNAYKALGRLDDAIDQYQRAILIRENYPEVYNNMGSVLREKGQLPEAEHAYRRALSLRKTYVDALVNLASLCDATQRSDDALRILGEALTLSPRHSPALIQVARIQNAKGNFEHAEQAARAVLRIDPRSADAHGILAQALHETDRMNEAMESCEKALELNPMLIDVNALYGICLKSLGRMEEASIQFEKTLELAPMAYGIYGNLADLQKFTPDNHYFQQMEKILGEASDPEQERYMPLHFAIGKAYDDIGSYEKAFSHFLTGARIKRGLLNYEEGPILQLFDTIRSVFTESLMRNPPYQGKSTEVPVFIVGMPRSGSTLVEQVLANHPAAFGAGEIKEFSRQLNLLRGRFPGLPKYPHMVEKMNQPQFNLLAEGYLNKLVSLAPGAQRITDKLLTNYFFVGLMHMLFPKAKFIHTRRNPVDTCLSTFTKLFKDELPHSYDLGELGRYYRKYEELMAHWEKVLPPGTMKTVVYEDVVDDMPRMARELIAFIGLPWDDACLSFHESSRPVKTASVVQVRQPVYSTSVGRWKRYGDGLKPLLEALDYHE